MLSAQPPVTFNVPGLTKASTLTPTPAPQTVATEVVITQQVAVTPEVSRSDMLVGTEQWTWAEFRDYVVAQITERFGAFPRDARTEHAIFKRFFGEYGTDAIAVAKFAFGPVCDGWWRGAPISVNRFCKASDPYFVQPILERLADTESPAAT